MIFSSISDLVLDIYYDENLKYIGCDGGITALNITCNLSKFGFNTKCYGVCGNDHYGHIAIKSLKDCKVKTDIDICNSIKTRAYHIRKVIEDNKYCFRSIKYCPFCLKSSWYEESYINEVNILNKIKDNEILIFDNLNNKNQYIINKTNNIKLIDLGSFDDFINCSSIRIISKISNNFYMINLNQRVEKYLLDKLKLKDDIELYKVLNCKLLIITRGKEGSSLVYRNRIYNYLIEKETVEVDDSGAGDIFFSTIIKNWALNNYKLSSIKFNSWIKEATNNSRKIITLIGSRTLIKDLYKSKLKKNCDCNKGTN